VLVEVIRDQSGKILDVRSADDLKRRPWAAGDRASFTIAREEWDGADYADRTFDAKMAPMLADATIEDMKAELESRGVDPVVLDGLIDGRLR